MPQDTELVDECSAELVEFARTDPFMRRALAQARKVFFRGSDEPLYARDEQQREMAQARLLDWFVFDYQLQADGPTPLDTYIRLKGQALDIDKLAVLRDLRHSVYGVFEVMESRPSQGMTLRDLADDTPYPVRERTASTHLSAGTYVLARVIPMRDEHVLSAALSVWSEDARDTILAAYQRTRAQAESIYISPLDMEKLFCEAPRLAAPPVPQTQEAAPPAEPAAPAPPPESAPVEEDIRIRPRPTLNLGQTPPRQTAPADEDIRAYAANAQSPLEVLEIVRARHPVHTAEELQQVMERVHRIWPEYERTPASKSFELDVNIPVTAGPRERALMRQFAAIVQREITTDKYPAFALARAEMRTLQRRWLDTRQERLDYCTPREIIQAERERISSCRGSSRGTTSPEVD